MQVTVTTEEIQLEMLTTCYGRFRKVNEPACYRRITSSEAILVLVPL